MSPPGRFWIPRRQQVFAGALAAAVSMYFLGHWMGADEPEAAPARNVAIATQLPDRYAVPDLPGVRVPTVKKKKSEAAPVVEQSETSPQEVSPFPSSETQTTPSTTSPSTPSSGGGSNGGSSSERPHGIEVE